MWIDPSGHLVLSGLYLRKEGADILVIEREPSRQESKEDDATGPYVGGGPAVFVAVHNFRAGVVRAAAASLELKGRRGKSSHAPVRDLDEGRIK